MASRLTVQGLIDSVGGAGKLAERLDCARTTVLDWRRTNTIPGSRIAQISGALGIPPALLLPLAQPPRRSRKAA
jgi:hypothetical protein